MNRGLPEKKTRNDKVYEDWKKGSTYRSMSDKYGLAVGRLQTIIRKYWAKYGRERN